MSSSHIKEYIQQSPAQGTHEAWYRILYITNYLEKNRQEHAISTYTNCLPSMQIYENRCNLFFIKITVTENYFIQTKHCNLCLCVPKSYSPCNNCIILYDDSVG